MDVRVRSHAARQHHVRGREGSSPGPPLYAAAARTAPRTASRPRSSSRAFLITKAADPGSQRAARRRPRAGSGERPNRPRAPTGAGMISDLEAAVGGGSPSRRRRPPRGRHPVWPARRPPAAGARPGDGRTTGGRRVIARWTISSRLRGQDLAEGQRSRFTPCVAARGSHGRPDVGRGGQDVTLTGRSPPPRPGAPSACGGEASW